jgi:hypothetical protein
LAKIAVVTPVVVFQKTLYTEFAPVVVFVSHQTFVFVTMDTLVHSVANMVAEQQYTETPLLVLTKQLTLLLVLIVQTFAHNVVNALVQALVCVTLVGQEMHVKRQQLLHGSVMDTIATILLFAVEMELVSRTTTVSANLVIQDLTVTYSHAQLLQLMVESAQEMVDALVHQHAHVTLVGQEAIAPYLFA